MVAMQNPQHNTSDFRERGICPPSNPFRTPGPDRDFWPLIPKPQLPPCPAECPRPFRFRFLREPGCGPRLFSRNRTFSVLPENSCAEEAAEQTRESGRVRLDLGL
ncbi:(NiFe) hydrogenase maturation protein HypF [Striga asiatica]|uniref:(NiFe) hydrogenase maturation protein HypF n=1 Tax=Striga asiatica TaxID=4170 RepID=A0A5A7PJJ0_STRAF|nr:(NiFe) hydrogenase maturation protein HypF [Striga asiatica]